MRIPLFCLTVVAALAAGAVNNAWIGGAQGEWNTAGNWNQGKVPGEGDVIIFDSTEPITVLLGAEQAMAGFATSETTPCVTFKGLDSGSVIKARQDIKSGVLGPVVFDEHTYVQFIAGKVWSPAAEVKLLGGIGSSSKDASTLNYSGSGRYVIRGPVDFPNGVTLAAPIDWNPSSVTEGSYFNVNSCDLQYNSAPGVERSTMRASGGTGGFGGSAPLCLKSADGTKPAFAINQWANPNLYLRRTMPTVIEDWFSLCNGGACNNNKVGFSLGSGAELRIPGVITSCNTIDYVADAPTGGGKLWFGGCGANVRITGENTFQGGGSSFEFLHANGVGYNSVEIDGTGAEIHPFGAGDVYSNNGHGIFIKALSPGKTLVNGFSYGNSINNNNAYTFGFDGTNDLIVSGNFTLGTAYSMIPVIGDMTLTLTGTLDPKAMNFDFAGTGDVVLGPTSRYTGTTGTLVKHSAGDLTLQGKLEGETYNKAYFSGGKTTLDYTVGEASSRLNTANSGTALTDALRLRGTELVLKGGAVAETVGEGNGTTFQDGLTKIRRDGGTSTIYLGTISPTPTASFGFKGLIDVESGVASVPATLAGSTLAGHFTVDGAYFGAVDENGVIVRADDSVATKVTGDQSTSRLVENYIILEPSAAGQALDLGASGAFYANMDGMIYRGDIDYAIRGGSMGGANTYNGALKFTCAGNGTVTYDGKLDRYGFSKCGPGTFRFAGTSALTMSLNLYEGVFEVASENGFSDASKSNYQVYLNGGTLKTSVDVELVRQMSVGDNGGVIEVVEGTTFTQTGNIVHTTDNTCGPVIKKGEGTWVPSGDFQAAGKVRIEAGTVRLGAVKGLGDSSARTRAIAPTELVGGTLDVAGFAAKLGNFYLKGGTVEDSSAEHAGSLAAYTHFVEEGAVNVALADGAHQNASCYFNSTNLKKYGPGTVSLNATNTFTGTAYVEEGVLELDGGLAGGACVEGGEFKAKGSIGGFTAVTGSGVLSVAPGAILEVGGAFAVFDGGTLRIDGGTGGRGLVRLTGAFGDVTLGADSRLELKMVGVAWSGKRVLVELPTGARVHGEFANFVGGKYRDDKGNKFYVNYAGGDGNDIEVTSVPAGLRLIVR